ncbi:hypothetical protein FOA52_003215 [Chlamydomonas sp. UWO 241]|nr:hypothetical protein FOA52_003215 [Chlamydomonas sp. UWO 241]
MAPGRARRSMASSLAPAFVLMAVGLSCVHAQAPGLDTWCGLAGFTPSVLHSASQSCTTSTTCPSADNYWTSTSSTLLGAQNCLLAGPLATGEPWNNPLQSACQNEVVQFRLADSAFVQYGSISVFTTYDHLLTLTVALDGQVGQQLMYNSGDGNQGIRLFLGDFFNLTTTPPQYAYWPNLVSSDKFTCMTLQVNLQAVCNPLTSTYIPTQLTLRPVEEGGNYGCYCNAGPMFQGFANCPPINMTTPGFIAAWSLQLDIAGYQNTAGGCGTTPTYKTVGSYNAMGTGGIIGLYAPPQCSGPVPPLPPTPPPQPAPPPQVFWYSGF